MPLGLAGFEHVPVAGLQVPASWHWSCAVQLTGFAPVQVPAWHVSVCVQASPSLQAAPLGLAGLEHAPVAGLQVPASWHWSCAVQATGFAPVHAPAWQVSVRVHALPSSHAVPLGFAGLEQVPVVESQVPASWHWSGAGQVTGFAPVHVPAWQVSLRVHALPSSHAVPLGFAGLEQVPVVESQVPASWHWSGAGQVTGFAPVHVPAWQVSLRVHALPSSHAVPLGFAGLEQVPVVESQVPASWHWSGAGQVTGFAPVHVPAWQVSLRVHALPSSHAVPLGFAGLEQVPVVESQVPASWHWSGAGQVTGFAPVHAPAWQVSGRVHALPSSHAVPLGFAGLEQVPVVESQVPASWHWSCAGQVTGFAPVHVPAWEVSVRVSALPSSHAVVLGPVVVA